MFENMNCNSLDYNVEHQRNSDNYEDINIPTVNLRGSYRAGSALKRVWLKG